MIHCISLYLGAEPSRPGQVIKPRRPETDLPRQSENASSHCRLHPPYTTESFPTFPTRDQGVGDVLPCSIGLTEITQSPGRSLQATAQLSPDINNISRPARSYKAIINSMSSVYRSRSRSRQLHEDVIYRSHLSQLSTKVSITYNCYTNSTMSPPPTKHQAAIIPQKGGPLSVVERPTPTPGPKELLIEVHALALNPVDFYQRDLGLFIQDYPAITGSDVSGIVIKTGSDVHADTPKPGSRVTAFASSFFHKGRPEYGAYQRYVLVNENNVSILPASYTFVEGAVFPMAAMTTWNGWLWAGIPRVVDSMPERQGVLVWGASSSMGCFAVQEGKLMGFAVYATASPKHHAYLKSLGAARVFDYTAEDVVSQIVDAAREDGLSIRVGFHATGSQQLSVDVMGQLRGEAGSVKLAIAPRLDTDVKVPDGVETAFVQPPLDPEERKERCRWIFGEWLQGKLAAKQLVASPQIKVVDGGLQSANKALDELKAGVSGLKLVLEL